MSEHEEELKKIREHKAALKAQIQAAEIKEAILNKEVVKESSLKEGWQQ